MQKNRIAYKKEPVLHVHRYIVQVIVPNEEASDVRTHYCKNKEAINDLCKNPVDVPTGAEVRVFSAVHNFKEAFTVTEG